MKINIPEEWCKRMAELEGDAEIGAGLLSRDPEFDANVDRLKACEHIADGDEGWEALRNECPSTAAVARLRDSLAAARARITELERVVGTDRGTAVAV